MSLTVIIADDRDASSATYQKNISVVVIVPMLVELVAALALLVIRPPTVSVELLITGMVLVGLPPAR